MGHAIVADVSRAPLLELKHATVTRAGRPALKDITLAVPVGRHTAILGPNGSGKSTLVKLVTRELYPLANSDCPPIRILGQERWEVEKLRTQLGIVSRDLEYTFQSSEMGTVFEAVLSGFFASHGIFRHQKVSEDMKARASFALHVMGVESLADNLINQISTGEARRVLIARALVPNPGSLLLDEPTTGLDLVARRQFLESLRQVAREGKTIVLVTHHVEEILPEIEWIVLLKEGRVAFEGPKNSVLVSDRLTDVFGDRIRIKRDGKYFVAEL